MPDAKLTELTNTSTLLSGDKFYVVSNNLSKSTTLNDIAQNLPSILTTGNANVSGNIGISSPSKIELDGIDYSVYVHNQIRSIIMPLTGTGLVNLTTNYSVITSEGNTTYSLSSNVNPLLVSVPNQPNYEGFKITFIQRGTASIHVSAGVGVTIGSYSNSLSSSGQYSKIELSYLGDQTYILAGNLGSIS